MDALMPSTWYNAAMKFSGNENYTVDNPYGKAAIDLGIGFAPSLGRVAGRYIINTGKRYVPTALRHFDDFIARTNLDPRLYVVDPKNTSKVFKIESPKSKLIATELSDTPKWHVAAYPGY